MLRVNSTSGLDYTSKYPPVAKAIKNLAHDVILDGEIVVFNKEEILISMPSKVWHRTSCRIHITKVYHQHV